MSSLVEELNGSDPEIRKKAIQEAPERPDETVVEALMGIVEETEVGDENRQGAAEALGRIGDERSRGFLLELMQSEDPNLRGVAAIGLGRLHTEESMEALLKALKDKVNNVRNLAERSLLKMMDLVREKGIDELLDLLKHPVPLTRSPAARLIGLTEDSRGLQPLLKMVQEDRQWLARLWAAKGLGDLGQAEAFDTLAAVVKEDEKNRVRAAAAEAVGKLRTEESEALLKAALEDEDGGVRKMAEEALEAMAQAGFEEAPDAFDEEE